MLWRIFFYRKLCECRFLFNTSSLDLDFWCEFHTTASSPHENGGFFLPVTPVSWFMEPQFLGLLAYLVPYSLFRRVLKYERFDPPTTASPPSSSTAAEKSSPDSSALLEGGPPKPLDLDLMTDLKDVIFSSAPPVNRHVSSTRTRHYQIYVLDLCTVIL